MRRGLALALLFLAAGCHAAHRDDASLAGDAGDAGPPWAAQAREPDPRPGMVWIPPGVLISGTPEGILPRVADEEMAGEQVVMHGFYVDVFPYPNEAGAIPTTSVSQAEAKDLCQAQNKRLCTELELERACKGPSNTVYEYGDAYKPAACGTAVARSLIPNGFNTACVSAFGVHDLHGSAWSWTASQWKRDPGKTGLFAARGGDGTPGELISRCANGRGVKGDARREDIGARCCAGEPNTFEVMLAVTRGEPLRWQAPDDKIAPALAKVIPEDVIAAGEGGRPEDRFKLERLWAWHPLGNEEMWIGGGCARPGQKERARCGIVIARIKFDAAVSLAWVASEYWQPQIAEADTPREIFLLGGDRNGAFRRRVSYAWGKIDVGEKQRKKKHKGRKEPTY